MLIQAGLRHIIQNAFYFRLVLMMVDLNEILLVSPIRSGNKRIPRIFLSSYRHDHWSCACSKISLSWRKETRSGKLRNAVNWSTIGINFPHHFLSKAKRSVGNKESGQEKLNGYATSTFQNWLPDSCAQLDQNHDRATCENDESNPINNLDN